MREIKAIETTYDGYRFRSRLEARWAVFFKKAGIKYEYEPEGYDLGKCGLYLPDFYLPYVFERGVREGVFVEIKPSKEFITEDVEEKLTQLALYTNHPVVLCCGKPSYDFYSGNYGFGINCSGLDDGCYEYVPTGYSDYPVGWDNYMHFQGNKGKYYLEFAESNYDHGCDESMFLAADAAKMARFEHGERP